jgi:hypothetical protein
MASDRAKYEYRLHLGLHIPTDVLREEEALNRIGEEGWELSVAIPRDDNRIGYWFKRPKAQAKES